MSDASPLQAAEKRLAQAIGRLEAALQTRATDEGSSNSDPQLQAQLDSLSAENQELRTILGSTAQRLDGTIAKFKSKLAADNMVDGG
ncbi:MAG: DUF4164 domain-containing protein [Magnetovibrio sp.]|nr:DUF4164 domain-containing protein [Magnetovibrio sp.]